MSDLESLEAVAALSFFPHHIEHRVDQFGTFSIMTLGPVVTGTGLSEDKVVGSEQLTERTSPNGIHGSGFEIHKDSARHVASASRLVEVDVDPFELKVGVSVIGAGRVDAMLIRDDLPEFGTNLVAALAALDVNDFSHPWFEK